MRSIAIRIVALFLQLTLLGVAAHVMGMLIARLFEARIQRCRQLPAVDLLFLCLALPSPETTD